MIVQEMPVTKTRTVPAACAPIVRMAKKADIRAIYTLIMTGVAQDMTIAPVNELKVAAMVNTMLCPAVSTSTPRPVMAVIDGDDDNIAAAAPIIPTQLWYSDEWFLSQPWIFVRPPFRQRRYAKTLIETCLWWSDRVRLPIAMSVPATDDFSDRREALAKYTQPFGGIFIHTGASCRPTPKPFNVRVASVADYAGVKELCDMHAAENAEAKVNPDKVQDVLMRTLTQERGIVAVATDRAGKIVGGTCLALGQWPYSLTWHYGDYWTFVRPEHRKTSAAADLLNFSKWWTEQTGIPTVLGVTSRLRTRAKVRLYGRYMKPVETLFLHGARGA